MAPDLLTLYDQQLRTTTEVGDADELTRIGPLWVGTYLRRRRAFITYRTLSADDDLGGLAEAALAHVVADQRVDRAEWKTRAHDPAPDLLGLLARHGFKPQEQETVMAGEAASVVAAAGALPAGYRVERAASEEAIRQAEALAGRVFGDDHDDSARLADELVARIAADPQACEMWLVRDAGGTVVCSGRVDVVAGSDFASLWGGACDPAHRGRGLYRAITAARARSALEHGRRFLHSDCTPFSRPILHRAGLVAITTSTPAVWRRPPPGSGQPG